MIIQLNALRSVAVDIDIQGLSRTLKRQIVKRDTFPENDFIRTAGLNDFVEPVAQIPNIGIVAVSSVQVIIARSADKRVIPVSGVYRIVSAVAVNRIVEIRA